MKTFELMQTPESVLAPKLKVMKLKELEKHATKILANLGASYEDVLRVLIKAVPKLDEGKTDRLQAVKNIVRDLVPTASNESDVDDKLIERVTVILIVIITRKLQKIMSQT